MLEEILPRLYRIVVPLPRNPLKELNSYVIKAPGRSLIIDTGMNREECMSVLSAGLGEIGIDLTRTDFFITHMHADHSGLVSSLATDTSKVYFGQADAAVVGSVDTAHWERQMDFARKHGFPEEDIQRAISAHPGFKYSSAGNMDFHILKDGDTVGAGDYLFECIETPGHTRGHLCLYEPDKKILISGDHILIDITPNISLWFDGERPLNDYLASLDKVYNLDVELVLPGHRGFSGNHRQRIDELKRHHQDRADEVFSILGEGAQSAYQVAMQMSWDIDCEQWQQFPVSQKWFATGEAIAHLYYLVEEGRVRTIMQGQGMLFCQG